jgi:hypothetical protein
MKAFIRPKTLFTLAGISCAMTGLLLAEPAWWVMRGVRDPSKPASDYGALNQGQLKNLARAARDEMEAKFPGGAGPTINTLVNSWATPTADTSDFAGVNVGQLKAVAGLFYARYAEMGIPLPVPWSGAGAQDYTLANVGQAKNAFSFAVLGDADADTMNDTWEQTYFGGLSRSGFLDSDGDGLSDLQEWQAGSNPLKWDSDGDGVSDLEEVRGGGLCLYTPHVPTRLMASTP